MQPAWQRKCVVLLISQYVQYYTVYVQMYRYYPRLLSHAPLTSARDMCTQATPPFSNRCRFFPLHNMWRGPIPNPVTLREKLTACKRQSFVFPRAGGGGGAGTICRWPSACLTLSVPPIRTKISKASRNTPTHTRATVLYCTVSTVQVVVYGCRTRKTQHTAYSILV